MQALARYSGLMTSKLYPNIPGGLSDVEWEKTKIGILNGSGRVLTPGAIALGLQVIVLRLETSKYKVKPR